jgi:hypothetical protein
MTALIISENENELLLNFLSGDAVAAEPFLKIMEPRILRTARRIGRDLPEDLPHEIVQQTFANLLITKTADFDPSRGTAWQFLIGKIWNAEKQVRTSYGYPPRRKQQNIDDRVVADRRKFVSVEAVEALESHTPNYGRIIEGNIYVAAIMRRVSPPLASALRLICYENKTKQEAAKLSGLSRFQLHRQLGDLRSQMVAT